ncbi:hypothetical protein KKF61_01710, partial [Patescibacteria group bacterium]|nr:hypothetical protein [Patescibacteria group bacterium]
MDEYITMSPKEVIKYDIIKKLINREINGTEAANMLNLTIRHVRRLKKKVNKKGIKGLIHGNRGTASNRKIPDKKKEKIKKLLHSKYPDFGPTFAAEKLDEIHSIKHDPKTIRSIMIAENLWKPKQKKKEKHREWRQRKAGEGEMIQYDGSYEHWFEDRGEEICLLAGIDDAPIAGFGLNSIITRVLSQLLASGVNMLNDLASPTPYMLISSALI